MVALPTRSPLAWPLVLLLNLSPSGLALRRFKEGWSSTESGTDALVDLTPDEALSLVRGSSHHAGTKPEPGYYDGNTPPIARIGLPALKMQYGAAGFQTTEPGSSGSTIAWPSPLALASTWDEELVGQVAAAVGREFRGKGANVMLGPSLAVGRDSERLSGEDPYLGSRLAPVFVRGVQGEGVMCAVRGLGSGIVDGNVTDARTAWELHYPAFEAAVRAGAGAVLCSNGEVNGTRACHSEGVLRRDLRAGMGFRGMVLSEAVAVDSEQALEAGVDLELQRGGSREGLSQPDPVLLELATVRVRTAVVQAGLKADSCVPPNCTAQLSSQQANSQQRALALRAAVSAVTLLKNDGGLLPLDPARVKKLALLGSAARSRREYYTNGVVPQRLWSTLESITQRASKADVQVLMIAAPNAQLAQRVWELEGADAVVVVAGTGAGSTLGLDDEADEIIEAVGALGKPTAVLMQTAGAVLTPWREASHVKSIANLFLGGEETGAAWAAVLFGDEAPEGRLPVMLPADNASCEGCSEGGLFSSYRSPTLRAAFPFGHGLSYTEFTFSDPWEVTTGCAGLVCVNATVTNVGARAGCEVAQAYVEFAPGLGEPSRLLRGFRKLHLRPGESETVSFAFTERDLSVYYADGGWELQGAAQVYVGRSSSDLRGESVLVRIP